MPAVLDPGSPCDAASNQSLAVQAAVGPRAPQTSRDAAGSHTTAGHVASPPGFQKLQINASCCSAYSGQLLAACIVTDVLPLSRNLTVCPGTVAPVSHVEVICRGLNRLRTACTEECMV